LHLLRLSGVCKAVRELDLTTGTYQLKAAGQACLGNVSGIGALFGGLLNGNLVACFGQEKVLLASLFVLAAFIYTTFLASKVKILLVGEFLCGFPWSILATTAAAYAT
jgi:MFS transporter, SP family, general alpha glucoside:H+ symporter